MISYQPDTQFRLHYSYSVLLQGLTGSTSAQYSTLLFESSIYYVFNLLPTSLFSVRKGRFQPLLTKAIYNQHTETQPYTHSEPLSTSPISERNKPDWTGLTKTDYSQSTNIQQYSHLNLLSTGLLSTRKSRFQPQLTKATYNQRTDTQPNAYTKPLSTTTFRTESCKWNRYWIFNCSKSYRKCQKTNKNKIKQAEWIILAEYVI